MRGAIQRSAFAVALLAMALLNHATVRSIVMQSADGATGVMSATCMSLTGVAIHGKAGALPDKAHKVCDYCAAAAHAPTDAQAASLPISESVAWSVYAALQPLGPRGPPAFDARARDPPETPLTI